MLDGVLALRLCKHGEMIQATDGEEITWNAWKTICMFVYVSETSGSHIC